MLFFLLFLFVSLTSAITINLEANERIVYMDDEYIEIDILPIEGEQLETPHRELYEQINQNSSKSNKCKKCIDANLKFCPGNNYKDGICCNMTIDGTCPPGRTDYEMQYWNPINWCSDYNIEREAPYSMQYIVCPNEPTCGDDGRKFITPKSNGEVLRRDIDKYNTKYHFVSDDVCSWIVTNPLDMGNKDWMWLKISQVQFAEVWVNKAKDYVFEGRPATKSTNGKKFAMLKGKDYYVSGWSTSMLQGFFRIETWIEVYEPPAGTVVQPQPQPQPQPQEPEIAEEDDSFEDEAFYTKSKKEQMLEYYAQQTVQNNTVQNPVQLQNNTKSEDTEATQPQEQQTPEPEPEPKPTQNATEPQQTEAEAEAETEEEEVIVTQSNRYQTEENTYVAPKPKGGGSLENTVDVIPSAIKDQTVPQKDITIIDDNTDSSTASENVEPKKDIQSSEQGTQEVVVIPQSGQKQYIPSSQGSSQPSVYPSEPKPKTNLQLFVEEQFELETSNGAIIGILIGTSCFFCCFCCCFIAASLIFCDSWKLRKRRITDEQKPKEEFVPQWKRQLTMEQINRQYTPMTEGYVTGRSQMERYDTNMNSNRGLLEIDQKPKIKQTNPLVPGMVTLLNQLKIQNGEDNEDVQDLIRQITKFTNGSEDNESSNTTPMKTRSGTQMGSIRMSERPTSTPFARMGSVESWLAPEPLQRISTAGYQGAFEPINEEEKIPGDYKITNQNQDLKATAKFTSDQFKKKVTSQKDGYQNQLRDFDQETIKVTDQIQNFKDCASGADLISVKKNDDTLGEVEQELPEAIHSARQIEKPSEIQMEEKQWVQNEFEDMEENPPLEEVRTPVMGSFAQQQPQAFQEVVPDDEKKPDINVEQEEIIEKKPEDQQEVPVPPLDLMILPKEDPYRLPSIRKKIDFFTDELIVENLNTSRPQSAAEEQPGKLVLSEDSEFKIQDVEDEFDLQEPQPQNKVIIENFDVEDFKKQPCGEEILNEYDIMGENQENGEKQENLQNQANEQDQNTIRLESEEIPDLVIQKIETGNEIPELVVQKIETEEEIPDLVAQQISEDLPIESQLQNNLPPIEEHKKIKIKRQKLPKINRKSFDVSKNSFL